MDSTELSIKFNVGDVVVYPTEGVGIVECLEIRREREYLKIKLSGSDMDVLLPADNASVLGLRLTASAKEVKEALLSLSKTNGTIPSDWKTRFQENQALLKDGRVSSVAMIVNNLYRRSKIKELPALERKLYDTAISMLVDESSYVLGIDKEDMRKEIFIKLENLQDK